MSVFAINDITLDKFIMQVFEIHCDIVVEDKKVDDTPKESAVIEMDTEKIHAHTLLEESLDEISKKMNKDEAKVKEFYSLFHF